MTEEINNVEPSNGKNYTMDDLMANEYKGKDLILHWDSSYAKEILQKEYNRRHPREIFWITGSGKKINIKDMTDEHLLNAINYIDRMEESDWEYMSWAADTDLF